MNSYEANNLVDGTNSNTSSRAEYYKSPDSANDYEDAPTDHDETPVAVPVSEIPPPVIVQACPIDVGTFKNQSNPKTCGNRRTKCFISSGIVGIVSVALITTFSILARPKNKSYSCGDQTSNYCISSYYDLKTQILSKDLESAGLFLPICSGVSIEVMDEPIDITSNNVTICCATPAGTKFSEGQCAMIAQNVPNILSITGESAKLSGITFSISRDDPEVRTALLIHIA